MGVQFLFASEVLEDPCFIKMPHLGWGQGETVPASLNMS